MKRASSLQLHRDGILRLSTWVILAGSPLSLTSCDSSERRAREARTNYESESRRLISELDSQRTQLLSGEVPNNFHIPNIGYYHAAAHDFYPQSYNFQKDGKYFVNNTWVDAPGPDNVTASRPTPEVLRRIDEAFDKQQASLGALANQSEHYSSHAHSSGPGMGTALMMYWLLSGNRGHYSPGPGFASFGQRAPMWESNYRRQREDEARTRAYSSSGFAAGGSSSGSSSSSRTPSTSPSSRSTGSSSSSSPSSDSGSSSSASRSSSSSSSSSSYSSSSSSSSRGGFGSSGGSSGSSSS